MKLLDILKITKEDKERGVWSSGIPFKGEFKRWWDNGVLIEHCFYKNEKIHGEYKLWCGNGQIYEHSFWRYGKLHGRYKWWEDGELYEHKLYNKGDMIKDFLDETT